MITRRRPILGVTSCHFSRKLAQSKRVRFQDEDKANKQGDDIEDRPAQGNQGSAPRASCKDEAGDKQSKKDDHNDGGSNDAANNQKKINKAEPTSKQSDQTGDKSEGTSPCTQQKDDDKGAKNDDKASKDDDKASKDDGNNRDDGKQDFAEALSPKDEAGDKSQATPTSTQFGTQSCFEFGGLSPITPANNKYGLSGGMTLLDLMATPPEQKGLLFEVLEVPYVSFAPTEKKVFNDIVENEHKGAQDMVAMSDELNSELKDLAKKYEDKLLEELLKPHLRTSS